MFEKMTFFYLEKWLFYNEKYGNINLANPSKQYSKNFYYWNQDLKKIDFSTCDLKTTNTNNIMNLIV